MLENICQTLSNWKQFQNYQSNVLKQLNFQDHNEEEICQLQEKAFQYFIIIANGDQNVTTAKQNLSRILSMCEIEFQFIDQLYSEFLSESDEFQKIICKQQQFISFLEGIQALFMLMKRFEASMIYINNDKNLLSHQVMIQRIAQTVNAFLQKAMQYNNDISKIQDQFQIENGQFLQLFNLIVSETSLENHAIKEFINKNSCKLCLHLIQNNINDQKMHFNDNYYHRSCLNYWRNKISSKGPIF
eukprot:TRINITY_DN8624_c0_g1_i1.p1 TRINITY_DN8624_c0_g1~~TRINITY_DN8624_c0_g1_i1.p1  ORF type:complete len:244 (-),score=29.67 TRINITY_DN8624_c0_g1_i1:76-807(-)